MIIQKKRIIKRNTIQIYTNNLVKSKNNSKLLSDRIERLVEAAFTIHILSILSFLLYIDSVCVAGAIDVFAFCRVESGESHHFEHLDLLGRLALELFRVENNRCLVVRGFFTTRERRWLLRFGDVSAA